MGQCPSHPWDAGQALLQLPVQGLGSTLCVPPRVLSGTALPTERPQGFSDIRTGWQVPQPHAPVPNHKGEEPCGAALKHFGKTKCVFMIEKPCQRPHFREAVCPRAPATLPPGLGLLLLGPGHAPLQACHSSGPHPGGQGPRRPSHSGSAPPSPCTAHSRAALS